MKRNLKDSDQKTHLKIFGDEFLTHCDPSEVSSYYFCIESFQHDKLLRNTQMYFIATRSFLQNLCNSLCKRILWSALLPLLCCVRKVLPSLRNGTSPHQGSSIPAEPGCAIGVRGKQQDLYYY